MAHYRDRRVLQKFPRDNGGTFRTIVEDSLAMLHWDHIILLAYKDYIWYL